MYPRKDNFLFLAFSNSDVERNLNERNENILVTILVTFNCTKCKLNEEVALFRRIIFYNLKSAFSTVFVIVPYTIALIQNKKKKIRNEILLTHLSWSEDFR